MISEHEEMKHAAPTPQSAAVVIVATIGSFAVAYLLWAFASYSALSMRELYGDEQFPFLTGKLVEYRMLFWALPGVGLIGGGCLLSRGNHSPLSLILYVSILVFLFLVAMTLTAVVLAIPWMPMPHPH